MAEEARQMAEKALEEEAKAKAKTKEREGKAWTVYAKAKEKAMFAEEKQRMWKFACILSWIFFIVVVFWLNWVLWSEETEVIALK